MNYLPFFIFSEFFLLLLIPFANGFDQEEKKLLWKHFVKFEDVWARDDAILDRRYQEQRARFNLADLLKAEKNIVYQWLNQTKTRLITREATRLEFEEEKKKYQSETAATGGDHAASASAGASKLPSTNEKTSNVEVISSSEETDQPAEDNQNKKGKKRKHSAESVTVAGDERAKNAIHGTHHEDHQREALWKHLVKFEDVLVTEQADVDRQREENKERFKLRNSIGLKPKQIKNWLYNKKSKLSKNSAIIHQQFESEKKKYQSEMAATGGGKDKDKASSSPSASTQSTPDVDLYLNLEQSSTDEEDKWQDDNDVN